MFWFIVLLLLAGAGFYFYQKMITIEREIREEQGSAGSEAESVEKAGVKVEKAEEEKAEEPEVEDRSDSHLVTPEVEKMTSRAELVADEGMSLEEEILAAVKNLPGMKQTDIYTSFTDVSKSQLQKVLKEMDDDGMLRREKKGSSYLLYPL